MIEYEDRFCIFLDVLGFERRIRETALPEPDAAVKLQAIDGLLTALQRLPSETRGPSIHGQPLHPNLNDIGYTATQFSYSLVVSFRDVPADAHPAAQIAKHRAIVRLHAMMTRAVFQGFLFRGGMSFGKLFHTDEKMFGPAFLDAYRIEQSANYPRLMTDRATVERLRLEHRDEDSDYLRGAFKEEPSGLVYLNYLSVEEVPLTVRAINRNTEVDFFMKLSELIDAGLSDKSERVRDKYDWVARRFYASVEFLARENGGGRSEIFPIEIPRWRGLIGKYRARS